MCRTMYGNDIHDGMRRVVQTHEQFNGLGVTLSGKTGTAELDYLSPEPRPFYRIYDILLIHLSRSMRLQSVLQMDILQEMPALTANDIMEYIFDLADEDTILTGYAST